MMVSTLTSLGATTWPASTNAPDQTFFGTNNFQKTLRVGSGATSTVMSNGNVVTTGQVGLGTLTPELPVSISTLVQGNPASSGTVQTFGSIRLKTVDNSVFDIGECNGGGAYWLQVSSESALGTHYPLVLNPLGQHVGIGTLVPFSTLTLGNSGSFGPLAWQVAGNAASRRWFIGNDNLVYGDFAILTESSKGSSAVGDVYRLYIGATGNVGIPTTLPDAKLSVSGVIGCLGIVLTNTSSYIKWMNVGTLTNPPVAGAGTAYIFAGTNNVNAEIFTMNGAGTVKQISEHAMDAPPGIIDDSDPFPNISKEWNDYLGIVRWINRSREAQVAQAVIELNANSYEAWLGIQAGSNVALLANNNVWATNRVNWAHSDMGTNWYLVMKSFVMADKAQRMVTQTETYAEYNARLGFVPGSAGYRSIVTWSNVQAGIQSNYALSFTNALQDYTNALLSYQTNLASGGMNLTAPVYPTWAPPAVEPVPDWLHKRGVN